jgi:hypothetical protein
LPLDLNPDVNSSIINKLKGGNNDFNKNLSLSRMNENSTLNFPSFSDNLLNSSNSSNSNFPISLFQQYSSVDFELTDGRKKTQMMPEKEKEKISKEPRMVCGIRLCKFAECVQIIDSKSKSEFCKYGGNSCKIRKCNISKKNSRLIFYLYYYYIHN